MTVRLLFMLFAFLIGIPSFAQKQSDDKAARHKEMMEFKLKFLADEMELNDAQRKKFNEVYTQMESERRVYFKKMKAAEKTIKSNKNASEADYERATKEIADARSQMTKIEEKYEAKFASFLSSKQLYKMKEAETKFSETMRRCRDQKKTKLNK